MSEPEPQITDLDRDALDILPLSMIPIETPKLKRARLIKNVRLDAVVEIFEQKGVGAGHVEPGRLAEFFNWPDDEVHPDYATIRSLADLASYDIYTLRTELRRLGIPVKEQEHLSLSESKGKQLTSYMKTFTAPLIQQVFGDTDTKIEDFDQLIAIFQQPNKEEALRNLKLLAKKLEVELADVPRFLEDYGDIFLSLAYFKETLDSVVPKISSFLEISRELRGNFQLQHDGLFLEASSKLERSLNNIIASITGRFESFDRYSEGMWENITAESFRKVRRMITNHHATVGGVLCGLVVKMRAWDEQFGTTPADSAVVRRADFVMSEMRQGIEKIEEIEAKGRKTHAR